MLVEHASADWQYHGGTGGEASGAEFSNQAGLPCGEDQSRVADRGNDEGAGGEHREE